MGFWPFYMFFYIAHRIRFLCTTNSINATLSIVYILYIDENKQISTYLIIIGKVNMNNVMHLRINIMF